MFHYGKGYPLDWGNAIRFYQLAGQNGIGHAYYNIGLIYEEGNYADVTKDLYSSFRYYKNASKLGYYRAYLKLSKIYEEGKIVPVNKKKSNKYKQKAQELIAKR